MFWTIHHLDSTESTNDLAAKAGESGVPEGAIFVADVQTRGRGRAGRSWYSAPGLGLYASLLLRPRVEPSVAPLFTLLAGVAVFEALRPMLPAEKHLDIKWPNDLLVGNKKVGGILCQTALEGARIKYVVVGIGINVHHLLFPEELQPVATSLALEAGGPWDCPRILDQIRPRFDFWYNGLLRGETETLLRRWSQCSTYTEGKQVTWMEGDRPVSGITRGLASSGALRVQREDGSVELVLSGDVWGRT
ncbi:MAG: biotin--[acetyl-CoA-carboxylase] ligase [Acidobacteria bacterium]|nr:biotin--[acetyl-CoA-carboxylase] ligase [Acidobacteriota bacterium]